jgi:hypothetical protein
MTRWIALCAGACAAAALSLAATSAGAQTFIVEDAYAAAPPPVVTLAPPAPIFAPPATVYVAPAPVVTGRHVYVAPHYAPHYYAAPPAARVVVPQTYVGPGYVEADW